MIKTPKPHGIATVEEDESGKGFILLKVGPFKDKRAAQRKLTDILDKSSVKNPKQGALV